MPSKQRARASPGELEALRSLLAYQFGREACALVDGVVEVRRSPQTGRVREVFVNNELVGTVRATDGFFVPSLKGAERLLSLLPYPRSRVVVPRDVAEFVAEGRSVFCKHVVAADPDLRPGEEVAVTDETGRLVAVGRSTLSGNVMLSKRAGVAVKVRKGIK